MPPIVPARAFLHRQTSALRPHRWAWLALFTLVLWSGVPSEAEAQIGVGPTSQLQIGLAGLPAGGVQFGFVRARSFLTTESFIYAEGTPPAFGEGRLQLSAGFGGAVRLFGLSRLLGSTAWYVATYNLDLGLRLGPSLAFAERETTADKNQRFSLFLEPFLRFAPGLNEDWTLFFEAGTQRPYVRLGTLVDF